MRIRLEGTPNWLSKRVLIAVGAVLVLAGSSFGAVSYAGSQADERDQMRAQFASDIEAAAERAAAEKKEAVRAAMAEQKKRYTRLIKRARTKAKRDAKKAFERGRDQGYSSGSAAGYASGSADGYASGSVEGFEEGLDEGSDELSCSDDPDVYWLPPCF